MRRVAVVAIALAGTLLATPAFAQIMKWDASADSTHTRHAVHFSVLGAVAQPWGDFASTSSANAAFASLGGGFGLDFSALFAHDIETGALVLVDWNPTDSGALTAFTATALRNYGFPSDPLEISATDWRIGWGLVKAGYAPHLAPRVRGYVDVYAGGLLGHEPDLKLVQAPPQIGLIEGSQSWVGLAAGVGGGLRWREHYSVGLLYLSGARNPTWHGTGYSVLSQPISILHATLGYSFGH